MLSPDELKEFYEALLNAFPERTDLEIMVRFELSQSLNEIVQESKLKNVVFKLIQWAETYGRLEDLIVGAYNHNPGNPKLKAFCQKKLPTLLGVDEEPLEAIGRNIHKQEQPSITKSNPEPPTPPTGGREKTVEIPTQREPENPEPPSPTPEGRGKTVESSTQREADTQREPEYRELDFEAVTIKIVKPQGLLGVFSKPEVKLNKQRRQAWYFKENLGNNITLDMIYIPGGKFMMGTADEEVERLIQKYGSKLEKYFRWEQPQHEVTVPAFFMGKYPVTQALWKAVANLPQAEKNLEIDPSRFKGDILPVERVSWYDAVEFCNRLSNHTGREYRLPSEAEWEYACRAGTKTPFHFGETITHELANYNAIYTFADESQGEYREKTTPVGTFPPNSFCLYDMHGNVWEWCYDEWHENYKNAPINGKAWYNISNKHIENRVLRGGSWYSNPQICRNANRSSSTPDSRYDVLDFRLVWVVSPRTLT